MSSYFKRATICLNGHVSSSTQENYRLFCKECGEQTISRCENCETFIQGGYYSSNIIGSFEYKVPNYCHNCGYAYPWTQKLIDNAVEIVSLDENLSDEHKMIIKNAIPDLIIDTPTTPVAQAKYSKYVSNAAGYVQDALRNLLIDVVSEAVKKSIFN